MNYCYYIFTPKGVNYFLQYLLLIFFRGQAPEAVANLVWSIFLWWSQINDIQKMLALQNKLQSNRIDMKGVIQEYQETQRTAEVSEKKQAFLQDFKEMITEAIRALKLDTEWAELDLSKYFDTLNHEILMNLLRRNEKDERVVQATADIWKRTAIRVITFCMGSGAAPVGHISADTLSTLFPKGSSMTTASLQYRESSTAIGCLPWKTPLTKSIPVIMKSGNNCVSRRKNLFWRLSGRGLTSKSPSGIPGWIKP